jgi:hypothetical protein
MLSGIWNFEWKCVKNSSQRFRLLFTGVEFSAMFYCVSCKICWSKPWSAFVKVVEGQLSYNFAVDHLVHLCFKISSNQQSNSATLSFKMSQPRHTRDVVRDAVAVRRPARLCAHAEVPLRPPVRARCLGHCVKVRSTRSKALGRCHVLRPHALDGGAASRHWLDGRRTSPPIPPYPGHTWPYHDYSPWRARNPHHCLAPGYKGRRRPSSREHPNPAAVAIAAAVELLALLIVVTAGSPLAFPPVMLVLARPSIDLAGLPTRQSQRPGGRPIAAVDELCSPRDPLANQPSQRLH